MIRVAGGSLDFDAALLELESAATLGETITLHGSGENLSEGRQVRVTGWGATSEGGPGSACLLKITVPGRDGHLQSARKLRPRSWYAAGRHVVLSALAAWLSWK